VPSHSASSTLTGQYIINKNSFAGGALRCPAMMQWLTDCVYIGHRVSNRILLSPRPCTASSLRHDVQVQLAGFRQTLEALDQ